MTELRLVHVNVNSVRSKREELELYMQDTKPHIVLLNETKLCGKPMPGFAGFSAVAVRDRTVTKLCGGGVAVLVSKECTASDISPDMDDVAAVLLHAGPLRIAVVSYYCPPGNNKLDSDMVESYLRQYDHVIIAGDLNAKHQFYGSSRTDSRGDELFDMIERCDLCERPRCKDTTYCRHRIPRTNRLRSRIQATCRPGVGLLCWRVHRV